MREIGFTLAVFSKNDLPTEAQYAVIPVATYITASLQKFATYEATRVL